MKKILFVTLQIVVTLVVLEGLLLVGMENPRAVSAVLPKNVLVYLRGIYAYYDQRIIQYETAAAQWDKDLFYTLKPGRFQFTNREFSNDFQINSLGLRDSEDALRGPEVLVLGDSFAMGWGVEADERFGAILGKKWGKKVLHVAVSSWGTARESLMLKRVDLSRVEKVVIQFSQNDIAENQEFVQARFRLSVQPQGAWEEAVRGYVKGHRYHFGRYALKTINHFISAGKGWMSRLLVPEAKAAGDDGWKQHVDNLQAIIGYLRKNGLPRAQIVFFAPDETPAFAIEDLKSRKIPGVLVLHLAPRLDRERHFFVLDDHLNASGHQALAEELLKAI